MSASFSISNSGIQVNIDHIPATICTGLFLQIMITIDHNDTIGEGE